MSFSVSRGSGPAAPRRSCGRGERLAGCAICATCAAWGSSPSGRRRGSRCAAAPLRSSCLFSEGHGRPHRGEVVTRRAHGDSRQGGPFEKPRAPRTLTKPGERLESRRAPKWRNWQTRCVQGAVGESLCGFKSHLRHRQPLEGCLRFVGEADVTRSLSPVVLAVVSFLLSMLSGGSQ